MKCSVNGCKKTVVTKYPQHRNSLCEEHKQKFDKGELKVVWGKGINKIFKEY